MGSARTVTGWIHGTQEGLARHTAAGEEPCKDCIRAERKRVAAIHAREAAATPEQVEAFIERCRQLMAEREWTMAELARQLQTHGETVRLTLNGTNWPRKITLSRLSSRLSDLEDLEAFQQRRAQEDRAQQIRDEYNRRTIEKFNAARRARLRNRQNTPETQRELVYQ